MQDIDIVTIDDAPEVEIYEEEEEVETSRGGFYGKIPFIGKVSYFVFMLTVLLIPLFFLPSSFGFQLEFSKKLLFSSGILLSFALWLITRLEDGRLIFPGGAIFWTGLSLISSFLVSSVLSTSSGAALLGLGNENDTFIAIIIFFIAMFLSATLLDSMERLSKFFTGLIAVSSLVGLIELIQVLSPWKLLSGGVLANNIGKWNDLGVFFGLTLLLSVVNLELQPFYSRGLKKASWFLAAVSLFVVAVVNYNLIWGVVGAFALVILIYSLAHSGMFGPQEGFDGEDDVADYSRRKGIMGLITRPSFVVIAASVIFFFGSNVVGSVLGKYGIYQLEVRPSWQSTVEVAKASMSRNLYFGSGPNTFSNEWASSKPDAVNSTVFWNTDFSVGFGRVPSFAVTLGLFGLITSGLFLVSLLYYGLRALMASFDSLSDHFIILSSFIASFYLWSFSLFYVTDTVILVLTFVATGIFLSSLARAGLIRTYEFSFLNSPRLGFISVLMIVLLIISVMSGGYLMTRKFGALYSFQRGLYNFNNSGNLEQAESEIKGAIGLDEQDLYYRSLAEIHMIKLRNILNNPSSGQTKEALFNELQANLSAAAGSARRATEINPANYLNWMTLGKVGETVLPLKDVIAGSYDLAVTSYNKALALNPKNPNIYLSFAQLEAAKGDVAKAKEYINQALSRKSNFTAALFLSSQIEASQGNLSNAITKAEQAAVFSPGDVGVLFQIGLLKYMNKNYSGAAEALKAAVSVQPNYSNAKYFLGLSYSKLGQTENAVKEFEEISTLNPDSQEVKNILKNLKAGRGALENIVVTPPKSDKEKEPEKRTKLPVKEEGDN
jgi:tetratricopeptide (TPR) repeat protein